MLLSVRLGNAYINGVSVLYPYHSMYDGLVPFTSGSNNPREECGQQKAGSLALREPRRTAIRLQ